MPPDFHLRPATREDHSRVAALLTLDNHVHRHLDWRSALNWLGYQPYWLLENNGQVVAALACPPDPPGAAWVRLFVTQRSLRPEATWKPLFRKITQDLVTLSPTPLLAALTIQDWLIEILENSGFQNTQDIVVLHWDSQPIPQRPIPAGVMIRPMGFGDLPSVHAVDASAFDLIWRNSMDALVQAYKASAYATVIELDSRIVGYQICTATTFNAHLARLAVFPDLQRHSLGYLMVQDLLSYFSQAGLEEVTVNTQHNNQSSLALYQKIGFVLTGESIPVYTLTPQLPPNL